MHSENIDAHAKVEVMEKKYEMLQPQVAITCALGSASQGYEPKHLMSQLSTVDVNIIHS